jgi:hypothetical protein
VFNGSDPKAKAAKPADGQAEGRVARLVESVPLAAGFEAHLGELVRICREGIRQGHAGATRERVAAALAAVAARSLCSPLETGSNAPPPAYEDDAAAAAAAAAAVRVSLGGGTLRLVSRRGDGIGCEASGGRAGVHTRGVPWARGSLQVLRCFSQASTCGLNCLSIVLRAVFCRPLPNLSVTIRNFCASLFPAGGALRAAGAARQPERGRGERARGRGGPARHRCPHAAARPQG